MFKLTKATTVTVENAREVLNSAENLIEDSKSSYGFLSKNWKPLIISSPWVYTKRKEAKEIISEST